MPAERTTITQELAYLNALKSLERKSVERVEASGIFRGVRGADVDDASMRAVESGAVRLRAGVLELCERVKGGGGVVGVVSVAWSGRFIAGVLAEWARREGGKEGVLSGVVVRANEIVGDGEGGWIGCLVLRGGFGWRGIRRGLWVGLWWRRWVGGRG